MDLWASLFSIHFQYSSKNIMEHNIQKKHCRFIVHKGHESVWNVTWLLYSICGRPNKTGEKLNCKKTSYYWCWALRRFSASFNIFVMMCYFIVWNPYTTARFFFSKKWCMLDSPSFLGKPFFNKSYLNVMEKCLKLNKIISNSWNRSIELSPNTQKTLKMWSLRWSLTWNFLNILFAVVSSLSFLFVIFSSYNFY